MIGKPDLATPAAQAPSPAPTLLHTYQHPATNRLGMEHGVEQVKVVAFQQPDALVAPQAQLRHHAVDVPQVAPRLVLLCAAQHRISALSCTVCRRSAVSFLPQ